MKRRRLEEELERDIADHIAMETEDNIARGMSPAEARFAALRKFGNVARIKEDTRSVCTAALAVLSLALAFTPSVTMFSVMDRLFLTPLPVKAPGEIVEIRFLDMRPNAEYHYQRATYPEFRDFGRSAKSFSGLAYQRGQGAMVALNGHRVLVGAHLVSEDYFSVLGLPIPFGPGFLKGRPSLIVSHDFWMREFEGRRDIIGRTLLVNGQTFTIDGVAAPDFRGIRSMIVATDLWIPVETWLQLQPSFRASMERRDLRGDATIFARLRPGVPPAQAAVEVESIGRELAQQWPESNRYLTGDTYAVLTDLDRSNRNLTGIGVLLLGILLAVACANVAGILLARAEERRHETAIRQALGASRARLIRESKVLMNLLPGLLPSMVFPLDFQFSFGPRVWLYAASLVFFSALSFGLVPAWRGSRPDLLSGLRRDSAVSILHVRVPVRSLLIVLQVAAAEILLFSAGLVLDTLSGVRRLDVGFDPHRPVAMAVLLPTGEDGSQRPIDCVAVRDRLAQIGGVRRVAYSRSVPLSGSGDGATFRLEVPGQEPRKVKAVSAGPAFLSILGVPILSGRDLEAADQHAVLVNATLARQLDSAGKAVGREIRLDGAIRQIVGVFQDTAWSGVYDPPQPRAVALMPTRSGGDTTFTIEVAGNPGAYLAALRAELTAAQPGSVVASSKTLWQHYQDSLFVQRAATKLFYLLGFLALLLTITGLHGITSALFARRSKEFAIRLALGAAPRQIMAAVLASGLKLAAGGLALGLAIAFPGAIFMASKVPGFSPWSVSALGLSSAIVMLAAVAAAAHPARRVLRLQPGDIVRSE
ncbi:MAG: ABC transporter permease [Candidatus Solibacter sp.]|nr:ABC transporter permease [Candidatus Solibacter sp.]